MNDVEQTDAATDTSLPVLDDDPFADARGRLRTVETNTFDSVTRDVAIKSLLDPEWVTLVHASPDIQNTLADIRHGSREDAPEWEKALAAVGSARLAAALDVWVLQRRGKLDQLGLLALPCLYLHETIGLTDRWMDLPGTARAEWLEVAFTTHASTAKTLMDLYLLCPRSPVHEAMLAVPGRHGDAFRMMDALTPRSGAA